jgi:hypothetical protein
MKLIRDPDGEATLDATGTMYPSRLDVVVGSRRFERATSSHYGYVVEGRARFTSGGSSTEAPAGVYFCVPGLMDLEATGRVVVIERLGFIAMAACGRIESTGRLSYIDGCSDSVLVMPPRLGDPVLNHLHFPAGITQSVHSHPSIRLGVVASGRGVAYGPGAGVPWEEPMDAGCVFLLESHEFHAFRTAAEVMNVIAYHPDSDWGPTDGVHPMLNRTYLRG